MDTRADWSEAFAPAPSLQVGYVWYAGIHLAHHLVDASPERRDPGGRLAASKDLRSADVPGREVGERALALVVLDPARASWSRQTPWMDLAPCNLRTAVLSMLVSDG